MKIGILTLPLDYNYGGILQAYALQLLLRKQGHDAKVIDHSWASSVPKRLPKIRRIICYARRLFLHCFFDSQIEICPDYERLREYIHMSKNTQNFIDKYINYISVNDIIKHPTCIDAIVVGSDQVWRGKYVASVATNFFVDFISNETTVKKVAFSASFGSDVWEYTAETTETCARLAKAFDFISVREDSGVELCKKYLGVDATLTLDPTLLINKSDYIDLVEKEEEPSKKGSLFYYILDMTPEKMALVNKIATERNLVPIKIMPETKIKKFKYDESHSCPKVTAWLRCFMDADFVVTDSFHGCVFSIIFNKTFIAIGNQERGMARFNSLLKLFQLENRLTILENGEYANVSGEIDWEKVNSIHEIWRNKSLKLITSIATTPLK